MAIYILSIHLLVDTIFPLSSYIYCLILFGAIQVDTLEAAALSSVSSANLLTSVWKEAQRLVRSRRVVSSSHRLYYIMMM